MLRVLEIVLLMVAVASLTAFGLMKFEEHRGQAALRAQFEQTEIVEPTPSELPGEAADSPADEDTQAEEPTPAGGRALGRLTSERIGLDVMIAEGVGHATLRRAAGRIPGTARVGEEGNIGVAAHRDTFFRPLRGIQKGDVLDLETRQGHSRYQVDWMAVVDPSNVDSLRATKEPALTLVTCFPFSYVGLAPRRFIVRATRLGDAPSLASAGQ